MAVRKLSTRYVRFTVARALVHSLPQLKKRMPYYDHVRQMLEVGEAKIVTTHQQLSLNDQAAAFAAHLPEYPPQHIERSVALITLRDVTVLGSTGAVVDEEREHLLTPRGARDYVTYHDFRPALSTAISKRDISYFNMMGSHRGYCHYFHFMFDRLPRLYYLLQSFNVRGQPIVVLTNTNLPKFQKDIFGFIQQQYPNIQFEAIPHNERWRVRRLLHVDDYQPVKRTLADPKLLDFIRALVFGGYGIPQHGSGVRRIYVSRNDTPRRRVSNESDLLALLSRYGFEVVCPGTLTFRDQVALFGGAEAVVGPHGAGLTNILFSPRAAKVLELFPSTKVKNTYFLLALSLGQSYRALIGGRGSRREWFNVDCAQLERELKCLLGTVKAVS